MQAHAPIGERARPSQLRSVREAVVAAANDHGFPGHDGDVVSFDRAAAVALRDTMPISGSEAANREMWTWVSLVMLPDLTAWRWAGRGQVNVERWVARDLTRHTWARLWWQATTFTGHEDLLTRLHESDLNQIFERREIGGRAALAVVVAEETDRAAQSARAPRREIVRDVNKRLLRALAYIDSTSLDDDELRLFVRRLTHASVDALEHAASGPSGSPSAAPRRPSLLVQGWRDKRRR